MPQGEVGESLRFQIHHFPINELPVELLCRVFKCATLAASLWEEHLLRVGVRAKELTPHSPTTITHVCRHWRRVAIAEGTLWSTIKASGTSENALQHVQLYLARSGSSCPLDIDYTIPPSAGIELDALAVARLVKLLVDNVSRWRKVKFYFYTLGQFQALLDIPPNSATNLVAAHLSFFGLEDEKDPLDARKLLQAAPVLQELGTSDFGVLRNPEFLRDHITCLHLSNMTEARYRDILKHTPHLKELWAAGTSDSSPDQAPIILPNLLELYSSSILGLYHPKNTILRLLQAPSLKHLNINHNVNFSHHEGPFKFQDLENFLTRSKCNLKSLSIVDNTLTDDHLAKWLSLAPLESLEELFLRLGLATVDKTIQALTLSKDGQHVCARLKILKLFRCKTSRDGIIGECIRSRVEAGVGTLVAATVQLVGNAHDYTQDIGILTKCDDPTRNISYELRDSWY
ncbi:hypothetical protein AX16_007624 [Volvariella volvacea WC 439]|nr:hypothetical protein AX16_007624 [Volvariella volvacea WC 439]